VDLNVILLGSRSVRNGSADLPAARIDGTSIQRAIEVALEGPLEQEAETAEATAMPHAIYLHSGLTQDRIRPDSIAASRRIIRYSDIEVVVALGLAGLVHWRERWLS
jgi:hypothetical protein